MQIVKTYEEAVAAIGANTCGYIALSKKVSGDELHDGHASLVSYSKANYDLTMIGFWDTGEFMNYLFPENSIWDEMSQPVWDSTGCGQWCVVQGVDIVFVPEPGYTETWFEGNDMEAIVQTIENIWATEGYPSVAVQDDNPSEFNTMQLAQGMCISDYIHNDRPWSHVNTWKDGHMRFTVKDFATKYAIPLVYEVLDPVTCPQDGLYYSSAHYEYTQDQKDNINLIPGIVDTTGYANIQVLIDEINQIDPGNLVCYRIQVTEGGVVGAANDFVSVYFKYGELADVYPFYKEGVR